MKKIKKIKKNEKTREKNEKNLKENFKTKFSKKPARRAAA